ncbi:MAG: structural protein P5 [Prevotella sp.]|nr:structural protein P5 [Prevotella sp.]
MKKVENKGRSRGYRNNNPLNIIRTETTLLYKGALPREKQLDTHFVMFKTRVYGLRAAVKLLHRYFTKYGLRTVRGIINRWCPDATAAKYIERVCREIEVKPDEELEWNGLRICALVAAMAKVENGYLEDGTMADIYKAWQMYEDESTPPIGV